MALTGGPIELEERLRERGLDEFELYLKRGRSRSFVVRQGNRDFAGREERGWALRAGSRRGSLFLCGTGEEPRAEEWPEADGQPLRLPEPEVAPPWNAPASLAEPLLAENEGWSLVETLSATLGKELPSASLARLSLEDGESEAELTSSKGIDGETRQRMGTLHVEASLGGSRPSSASLDLCRRAARQFDPVALARRIADLLVVRRDGEAPERDRGDLILAPSVVVRLLEGLLPLLVGPGAGALARRLRDRSDRIAGRVVNIIDDGRLAEGLATAAIDGEGLPTARQALVGEGAFERPVLAWWQESTSRGSRIGCSRRPSWRDVPRPGPSHLYLEPDPSCAVGDLIASVARGYYLLESWGAARLDFLNDRVSLPVDGLALEQGRAVRPVANAWLAGSISGLLHGIEACGRDLTFFASGGLLGAPTIRVVGLELRDRPG